MTLTQLELRRLWQTLSWRGAAMLVMGLAAMVWPEPVLVPALIAVGLVATLLGLFELSIGLPMRSRTVRRVVITHSVLVVLFGALTAGVSALPLGVAVFVAGLWLVVYAVLAWSTAVRVGPVGAIRRPLVLWGCVNVGLAIIAVGYREATILALLFFGAAYAALFGAWQLAVGLGVRRLFAARVAESITPPPVEEEGVRIVRAVASRRTDEEIARDVVGELMASDEVPDRTIKARIQDRWVWLVGEAATERERQAAERVIRGVPGIKGITTLVRVKTEARAPA
jgi:uncharacterized membrane protein HdeD (DUF308 family)